MLGDADLFLGVATSPWPDPEAGSGPPHRAARGSRGVSCGEESHEGSSRGSSGECPGGSSAECSADPHGCPSSPLAPHGRPAGGGSAGAAPGGSDPPDAAARHCLLLRGAQGGQGGRQAGQAPCASRHPRGAGDLPVGQRPTQAEEEDGGAPGGETLEHPVEGKPDGDRAAAGDSGQQRGSSKRRASGSNTTPAKRARTLRDAGGQRAPCHSDRCR